MIHFVGQLPRSKWQRSMKCQFAGGCLQTFWFGGRHHCRGCGLSLCLHHAVALRTVIGETLFLCSSCDKENEVSLASAAREAARERERVRQELKDEDCDEGPKERTPSSPQRLTPTDMEWATPTPPKKKAPSSSGSSDPRRIGDDGTRVSRPPKFDLGSVGAEDVASDETKTATTAAQTDTHTHSHRPNQQHRAGQRQEPTHDQPQEAISSF